MKRKCLERKKRNNENKESPSKSMNIVREDLNCSDGDMVSVSFSLDHLIDFWILDSACFYHMKPNKELFDSYMLVELLE